MTCQHCQTRILDDEHRCTRCGRRAKGVARSGAPIPASTAATARAYDFSREADQSADHVAEPGQQTLFSNPNPSRVVAFESLTTAAERHSIRARALDLSRPEPAKQAKVELPRARVRQKVSANQQRLDFFGEEEVLSLPQSHIICDTPVAPVGLRVQAALIDCAIMLTPLLLALVPFLYEGGHLAFDKHALPFWLAASLTIPVLYKLLWSYAGRDTIGMSCAGIRLVDFDGNLPSRERRFQRMLASFISLLAAGIGLVWALVDEDTLTWHDHMSSTFPTVASLEE